KAAVVIVAPSGPIAERFEQCRICVHLIRRPSPGASSHPLPVGEGLAGERPFATVRPNLAVVTKYLSCLRQCCCHYFCSNNPTMHLSGKGLRSSNRRAPGSTARR